MLKLCKWAKKNGAVQIKVDGIEILFPPPDVEASLQNSAPPNTPMPPWLSEQASVPAPAPATPKVRPAINSESDHPDVYSRELDAWAKQRPYGHR